MKKYYKVVMRSNNIANHREYAAEQYIQEPIDDILSIHDLIDLEDELKASIMPKIKIQKN